ncbi:MAG: VOC family protein [Candidatus Methanomethylophilaceae archaeon]|nr:VOC family protein [Candidatus Methanomethylophilaceae archaeon]
MPLGDPGGGNFTYTGEGLPTCIFAGHVPVRDIDRAVAFYRDLLGMEILYSGEGEAALKRGDARIILRRSDRTGVDTGIVFGVDNPFDLRRRLIDEGVVFLTAPTRMPMGVYTSFRDDDGNILHAMEIGAELRL